MFYSMMPSLRLMVTGQENGLAYSLLPPQEAATHQYYPVAVPPDLIGQTNQRFSRLVSGNSPLGECVQVGQMLHRQIVPDAIQRALDENRSDYVLLSVQETEVPWELLYDGRSFWGSRFGIGRSLPSMGGLPPAPEAEESRALFIINPSGDLPEAEKEGRELLRLFRSCGVRCDYVARDQATLDETLLLLGAHRYDFIHYCGHVERGKPSALILKDGQRLTAEAVARSKPGAQVVFLNGCGGAGSNAKGELQDLVDAFAHLGARAVIGPLYPVADDVAMQFSTGFYEKFLQGVPAARALQHARVRQSLREECTAWMTFVLYGDPALAYLPGELSPLFRGKAHAAMQETLVMLLAEACRLAKGGRYVTTTHVFLAALHSGEQGEALCEQLGISPGDAVAVLEPFVASMNAEAFSGKALLSPNTQETIEKLHRIYERKKQAFGIAEFFASVLSEPNATLTRLLQGVPKSPSSQPPAPSGLTEVVSTALSIAGLAAGEVSTPVFLVALAQMEDSVLHRVLQREGRLPEEAQAVSLQDLDLPMPGAQALSANLRQALTGAVRDGDGGEIAVLCRLLDEGTRGAAVAEKLFGIAVKELLEKMEKEEDSQ